MSLATNVSDLATRIATEVKALRTLINGNAADLSSLTTTSKTNLVSAINEVNGSVSGGAGINDATTTTSSTWSSTKVSTELATKAATSHTHVAANVTDFASAVDARISTVVAGAPGTLDTLDELAAALGDDPNFATSTTTALGNRLRFDAAQTLTSPQQTQGLTNLGAASATAVGDTTTNFVTTFEAGLV